MSDFCEQLSHRTPGLFAVQCSILSIIGFIRHANSVDILYENRIIYIYIYSCLCLCTNALLVCVLGV